MNLQLTLANSAATAAAEKWKAHKFGCPRCSTAQRKRKPQEMCRGGGTLYADMKACQDDLAKERDLARLELAGQDALFGVAEAGGRTTHRRGDTT